MAALPTLRQIIELYAATTTKHDLAINLELLDVLIERCEDTGGLTASRVSTEGLDCHLHVPDPQAQQRPVLISTAIDT